MKRSRPTGVAPRRATRALGALAVALLALASVSAVAHARRQEQHQHQHQGQPTPTPAPKPTASPTPSTHDQHQHRHDPPAPQPTPSATPRAADHSGHTSPQPKATPTPSPAVPAQPPAVPAQTPARPAQTPAAVDHSGHQMSPPGATPAPTPSGPVLRLEELEASALRNSPALAQAAAAVRAAEGRRRQAGQMPNPVVGYSGENISTRAPAETSEHLFFVEQTFPLGGKLSKSRRVFASERDAAEAAASAARQRVLNNVRALYFEALGAERMVELRASLARLAREAVEVSKELYNVGQADRPDLLEIEIEAQRAEIERLKAENDREQVWQLLASAVGDPTLRPAPLAGSLEEAAAAFDFEPALAAILRDSPELRAAEARAESARAAVARARAERAPDLFVRGGAGYNREREDSFGGARTGAVLALETGVRLPLWNRNQGGIAAAEAEAEIAEREVARLKLDLRARLASSLRGYRNAQQVAEKYRTGVIPAARAAYEMYLSNFRQMAASYPQVLIAQRTLFQVQVEYARALVEMRRGLVSLRGFLLAGDSTELFKPTAPGGASDDR